MNIVYQRKIKNRKKKKKKKKDKIKEVFSGKSDPSESRVGSSMSHLR